jgi:hypothetical protein
MGNEPTRRPIITRISWRLVDSFAAMLDQSDREAVLGDFAEAGETAGRALGEIIGLVVRRQASMWMDWRPWLTFVVLMIPLAMVLSVLSHLAAGQSAVYTWMYANNWDWALLRSTGFWHVLRESALLVSISWLTLVCWAWTAGFVLGFFSKGILRMNTIVFVFMLAFGEIVAAPRYIAYWHRAVQFPSLPNTYDPVNALTFYRVVFPLLIQGVLVVLPAILGMHQGIETRGLPRLLRTIFLATAVLTVATMMLQTPGIGFLLNDSSRQWIWRNHTSVLWLIRFVPYWPALYLLTIAISHRWQRRVAVS